LFARLDLSFASIDLLDLVYVLLTVIGAAAVENFEGMLCHFSRVGAHTSAIDEDFVVVDVFGNEVALLVDSLNLQIAEEPLLVHFFGDRLQLLLYLLLAMLAVGVPAVNLGERLVERVTAITQPSDEIFFQCLQIRHDKPPSVTHLLQLIIWRN